LISKGLIEAEFNLRAGHFLNAAYFGPLPKRTRIAMAKAIDQQGWPFGMNYDWVDFPDKFRSAMGGFLGVDPNSISYNGATSEVISTVALGIKLLANERVALFQGEYPSDVLPWIHRQSRSEAKFDCHVDFYSRNELVSSPVDFVRSLKPNTKVICLSHVCFQTGSQVELTALLDAFELYRPEVFLVLDVTQSLGSVPIDSVNLTRIHVVVGSLYKWMLCPYGQAFAIWSERAMQMIEPLHFGWMNMPQAPLRLTEFTTELKPGARRFDRGQAPNMVALSGTLASLSLFEELGINNIYSHNRSLVERFLTMLDRDQFSLLSEDTGSCIVCLRSSMIESVTLKERLIERNIDVSVREGNLRVSFHLFNTFEDVEELLLALNAGGFH
jgi:selenocysteine lyase/cysteine desulfurase